MQPLKEGNEYILVANTHYDGRVTLKRLLIGHRQGYAEITRNGVLYVVSIEHLHTRQHIANLIM